MCSSSCMHFFIQIIFHVTVKEKKGGEVLHLIFILDEVFFKCNEVTK